MVKQDKFFELCTIGGLDEQSAYEKAYNTKSRKSLLTHLANKRKRSPELFAKIAEYKHQVYDTAKEAQISAVAEFAKERVLTAVEKREFLKNMIENRIDMEEVLISGIKTKRIKRKPTNMEKLRALQLDNLMAGHIAHPDSRNSEANSFMDFWKTVSQIDNKNIPDVLG